MLKTQNFHKNKKYKYNFSNVFTINKIKLKNYMCVFLVFVNLIKKIDL